MRVDENGVLRLDEDIEKLIKERKPQEAYDLLCSRYPEDRVKRIQSGEMTEEDDLYTPMLDAMEIYLGVKDFIYGRFGTSSYEHMRSRVTKHKEFAAHEKEQDDIRQKKLSLLTKKEETDTT